MGKLDDSIATLQNNNRPTYEELEKACVEQENKIRALESELLKYKSNNLPSKEEVESISSMLDLINKLDDSTIEKISKFGGKKL